MWAYRNKIATTYPQTSAETKPEPTPQPQPFYGPFSGISRVSWCQKRTSGLYGARED